MKVKVYLPAALATFLAATTGADVYAKTTIGREPFGVALREHVYWAAVQFVGTLLLLAPFVAVAFVCSRMEKQVRGRSVALIFVTAMLTLLYFYFQNHQASERAMLEEMWTAATLSIGLLPFFVGVPVVAAVMGAGVLAAKFDPRPSD